MTPSMSGHALSKSMVVPFHFPHKRESSLRDLHESMWLKEDLSLLVPMVNLRLLIESRLQGKQSAMGAQAIAACFARERERDCVAEMLG